MVAKNIIFVHYYKTTIGELIIGCFEDQICLIDFRYRKMRTEIDHRIQSTLNAMFYEKETPLARTTHLQIKNFLDGRRHKFKFPFRMVGTSFQKNVWKALLTIPYGSTRSYLEIAQKIGDKKAVRAVANANGANALALIIPCHRVIGSDNKLIGYAGGLAVKKRLLSLESKHTKKPNELPFDFNT